MAINQPNMNQVNIGAEMERRTDHVEIPENLGRAVGVLFAGGGWGGPGGGAYNTYFCLDSNDPRNMYHLWSQQRSLFGLWGIWGDKSKQPFGFGSQLCAG